MRRRPRPNFLLGIAQFTRSFSSEILGVNLAWQFPIKLHTHRIREHLLGPDPTAAPLIFPS